MSKKYFANPFVLLTLGEPGDDIVDGDGTGQTTTDPFPCSYEEWQIMFADDYDLDEDIDYDDYVTWWEDNEFPGTPGPET